MEILEKESVKNALNKIAKEENFDSYKISISSGSKHGENYGSDVYRIEVKNNESKLNLFMKIAREADREVSKICEFFQREEIVYTEIFPKFLKLQNEKQVVKKFESIAKCYTACSVEFCEYVVMSDLSVDGFILRDISDAIDFDHCKLVMEELGKLHAFSFALKDQKPKFFAKYKNKLPELNFKDPLPPPFAEYLLYFVNKAKKQLQIGSQYKKQWNNFIDNYVYHAQYCCNGELAEPYCVITHGDLWTNNILFKYENGKPVEMRLLDFQFTRYCSPVMDLVQYIFTTTEKPLRDLHYQELINLYYNSLAQFLNALGSDVEKLFPYSVFQNHLKQFGKFGLCIALLGADSEALRKPKDELYKEGENKRLIEIIDDLGSLGYI